MWWLIYSKFRPDILVNQQSPHITKSTCTTFRPFKIDCLFCASVRIGFTSILTATHTQKLGLFLSTKLFSDWKNMQKLRKQHLKFGLVILVHYGNFGRDLNFLSAQVSQSNPRNKGIGLALLCLEEKVLCFFFQSLCCVFPMCAYKSENVLAQNRQSILNGLTSKSTAKRFVIFKWRKLRWNKNNRFNLKQAVFQSN